MSTIDIMIDLETLDITPTSQILTLGAVVFDPNTFTNLTDFFYGKVDIDSYKKYPLQFTMSKSTLQWWMTQNEPARKEAFSGDENIEGLVKRFVEWLEQIKNKYHLTRIWSHGASFDIAILNHTFSVFGIKEPWDYRNIRDTRTLFALAFVDLNDILDIPLKGSIFPRHHSLGDCTRQIEGVRLAYKNLKRKYY